MNILVASDIHLLTSEIPNIHIVDSLRKFFTPERLKMADAVFFPGDVFDRLVSANALYDDHFEVVEWSREFMEDCKLYNTVIRGVRGTPYHDWNMFEGLFVKENKLNKIGADIRYYDDIHLEFDPTLKLWIGYIPDAIRPCVEQIYDEFVELMKTLGCPKVDYIIAHGFFDFQNTHGTPALNTAKFSALVRYAILCGHDHTGKKSDMVIVPGSFERLRYGEEGPKGGLLLQIIDGVHRTAFLENKNAARIRTFNFTDYDDDAVMARVEREIETHIAGREGYLGKIRFIISAETKLRKVLTRISKNVSLKVDIEYVKDETEVEEKREINKKYMEILVPLTSETITEQLLGEITSDPKIATEIINRVLSEVKK